MKQQVILFFANYKLTDVITGGIMKRKRAIRLLLAMMLTVIVALTANLTWANGVTVLPPESYPYGMTYGQWGALWWQWELQAPINKDPVSDTTGAYSGNQLSNSVFFLAGSFGGGPIVRHVNVPAGRALFFPLYNGVLTYPEDVPAGLNPRYGENNTRILLNDSLKDVPVSDLVAFVDGTGPLPSYRASETFNFTFPPDSAAVTDWLSWEGVPYQPGYHALNFTDGYWTMIAPLSAGPHTVEIKYPADGSYVDVTYNLTVIPLPSTLLFFGSGLLSLLGFRASRRH